MAPPNLKGNAWKNVSQFLDENTVLGKFPTGKFPPKKSPPRIFPPISLIILLHHLFT